MGAGKSSVGRVLGERLNWIFEDLDDRIERREGRSIAEIFRKSGEAAFRWAEHAALGELLQELEGGSARVIAMGGGAFVQDDNASLLHAAGAKTVFLNAAVEELWRRCRTQAGEAGMERPLLKDKRQFRKLYEARRAKYGKATLKIETSGRSVDAIAAEIAQRLDLGKIAIRTESGEVE